MREPLPPQYDPTRIESRLYRSWEERGYFRADAEQVLGAGRRPYVIVIPPPNVTSVLHMGHGLTYRNVVPVARIPGVGELNIGHSIVARAVMVGFERAVREMKALIT